MRRFGLCIVSLLLTFSSTILAQSSPKLSEVEAKLRKSLIKDLAYEVRLNLSETEPLYTGLMTISFQLVENAALRIDFTEGTVMTLTDRTGQPIAFTYDGEAIRLAKGTLSQGSHALNISYSAPYSKSRMGLFRYKDKLDGKVYVFSDFQPYDANRLYPLFDQPDLRAPLTLEVEVPESWQLVSTTRESSIKAAKKGRRLWTFPATQPLPPYLYSLHGGPFAVWQDPLSPFASRLFARASQAKNVRFAEWFDFTRYAIEYFEKLTDIPYPFIKLDQMLVPEFGGGMENVASVTYSEGYIYPGVRTQAERSFVLSIILHELAHMWFGNLVTTSWWDNLWLNESFASYMQILAQADHPDFRDSWEGNHRSKFVAIRADALPTTHPIVQAVADTNSTNFDRITYNKGAAFLRVFHQKVGDESFKKGLNLYLKTHAFGNATIADWVKAFEKASGQDLKGFVDSWTLTAGTNELRAEKTCSKDGKLEQLTLVQTAPATHPTLREHTNRVDLYSIQGGQAKKYASIKAQINGERTKLALADAACPDLVFPNADDSDFSNIVWAAEELAFLLKHGEGLEDPLLKLNMMSSLFVEVEMGRIPVQGYTDLILRVLEREKNSHVLDFALRQLMNLKRFYLDIIPDLGKRKEFASKAAQSLSKAYQVPNRSDSDRIDVFGEMISMLLLVEDLKSLEAIWQKPAQWRVGLEPNDNRWLILQAMNLLGSKQAKAWAEQLKAKDTTNSGDKSYLAFQVQTWPYQKKLDTVKEIMLGKANYRQAEVNSIFESVFSPVKRDEWARFIENESLALAQVASKESSKDLATAFIRNLTVPLCNAKDKARYEKLLAMNWTQNLMDLLRDQQVSSQRCLGLQL